MAQPQYEYRVVWEYNDYNDGGYWRPAQQRFYTRRSAQDHAKWLRADDRFRNVIVTRRPVAAAWETF